MMSLVDVVYVVLVQQCFYFVGVEVLVDEFVFGLGGVRLCCFSQCVCGEKIDVFDGDQIVVVVGVNLQVGCMVFVVVVVEYCG